MDNKPYRLPVQGGESGMVHCDLASDLKKFAGKNCPVCELGPDVVQAIAICTREVTRPAVRQWISERYDCTVSAWELRRHIEDNHGKNPR